MLLCLTEIKLNYFKDTDTQQDAFRKDVYRRCAVLCIAVAMSSVDVMHISNLNVKGI
jgi:hypothetical protein